VFFFFLWFIGGLGLDTSDMSPPILLLRQDSVKHIYTRKNPAKITAAATFLSARRALKN
jgi:hypothetical protein